MPQAAQPVDPSRVTTWVDATTPHENRLYRFKWLFRDDRASTGGHGSIRIAAPDSLRFDVMGPFGANPSAAMVVGESAAWVRPEDALDKLVPDYALMWAMFGVARRASPGAAVRAYTSGDTHIWQYALGADTLEYARQAGEDPRLIAVARHAGDVVGRAETRLSAGGLPVTARLVVPSVPARLDITFVSSSVPQNFAPDVWRPHDP